MSAHREQQPAACSFTHSAPRAYIYPPAPLLDERSAVVGGQKEVGKYDLPDGDEEGE